MKGSKSLLTLGLVLACAGFALRLAVCAQAQTFTTLAAFNGVNGEAPFFGSMVQDTNGNYYGASFYGGQNGFGNIFQVTSTATVPTGATTGTVSVVTPSGTLNGYPQFLVTR
jgi:hypothetical protein